MIIQDVAEFDPYCRIINRLGAEESTARARAYAEPAQRTYDGRLCAAVIADPFAAPFRSIRHAM